MARAPRLSLSRRQLRVGIMAIDLALVIRREVTAGLASSVAEADRDYMAIREELSPRGRLYHPAARRRITARADLSKAEREIVELLDLRDRLEQVLERSES